ncbi:hypothetical protein F2P81_021288 [Scophthalmus maximus]|uniref:Uncharacterized protein n=1 Tax=Scophthalmus maximus TaxID=52904 RepID=A0A6A4S5Z4_SCOMX|nr:hypothetical protein F2P81_021288 [Scophthalmus maximus]
MDQNTTFPANTSTAVNVTFYLSWPLVPLHLSEKRRLCSYKTETASGGVMDRRGRREERANVVEKKGSISGVTQCVSLGTTRVNQGSVRTRTEEERSALAAPLPSDAHGASE